jgi:hypothetical protein
MVSFNIQPSAYFTRLLDNLSSANVLMEVRPRVGASTGFATRLVGLSPVPHVGGGTGVATVLLGTLGGFTAIRASRTGRVDDTSHFVRPVEHSR